MKAFEIKQTNRLKLECKPNTMCAVYLLNLITSFLCEQSLTLTLV